MITAANLRHRAAFCRTIAQGAGSPAVTRDLLMVARSFEHKARRLQQWQSRHSFGGSL